LHGRGGVVTSAGYDHRAGLSQKYEQPHAMFAAGRIPGEEVRARSSAMDTRRTQDVEMLIRMEYLEMPDLRLTACELRYFLSIPEDVCEAVLESLVNNGFLAHTPSGEFVLRASAV
jgi:hypothetical protein